MAWKKALIFLSLLALGSCSTTRLILLCYVESPISNCAKKDKESKLKYPEEMLGFHAWSTLDQQLLGSRLVQCEQDGKLPWNDHTLDEMKICAIGKDCGAIDGYFATDEDGYRKIKDKLAWCTR